MPEFVTTTVAFVAILGILVFFHELGHFSAAKTLGMKVQEFAFGFGPKLVTLFKRKETEYTIRAIPLGGFVRLPGMDPDEEAAPDGFNNQPIWRRGVVIFAGPFASFLLGYIVFMLVGVTIGFPADDARPQPVVGMVQPGMPADKVGLKGGDRILEVAGQKITSGEQVVRIIHDSASEPVRLVVKRGDRVFTLTATPEPQPIIQSAPKGSPAYNAGLKSGDSIVEINGIRVSSGKEVKKFAYDKSDKPLKVRVLRYEKVGDEYKERDLTVMAPPEALRNLKGLLGFAPLIPTQKTGIVESASIGTQMTYRYIVELVSTFTDREKIKNVGGIVAIARVTEKTVESGFGSTFLLVGMLSLGLAFINLFPWPILDGGHLLFLFIEWVRGGRKLTVEQQAAIQSLGLATLVFLAVLLIYVDITKWASGTPLQ